MTPSFLAQWTQQKIVPLCSTCVYRKPKPRLLPVLPLIGGGHTRLQPVFVEDVTEAIASILTDPRPLGRTYELAGPGV